MSEVIGKPTPTREEGPDVARLERAKVATALVFAVTGLAFASWAGRIPTTRAALDLTPGQLGLLLLAGSVGSLLGLPLAGRAVERLGAAKTCLIGACLLLGGLALIGAAVSFTGSAVLTGMILFLMCLGMGLWDVAMNIHGAEVERCLGRTIMPRFHAAFSLGTVGAALVAALLAAINLPLVVHFGVVAVLLFALTVYALRSFLPAETTAAKPEPTSERAAGDVAEAAEPAARPARSAWTEPRVLLIGLVMLVSAFTEGSANDWLSIAFVDGHHLAEWVGILGLATFLMFMTMGRLAGTHLLDRYGRVPVVRGTLILAGIGSLLMIFGNSPVAFVGAAIWGFGASLGFPVGMSAAADDPKRAAARVSVVSTIAYMAFLSGPPLLGFLGDHFGVLRALSVVSVMLIAALFAVPALREERSKA